jgi:Flp pilus assembly pilin Flp
VRDVVARLAARLAAARGRQEGQGLAEYSMILALIAIVAIASVTILGTDIASTLSFVGSSVHNVSIGH